MKIAACVVWYNPDQTTKKNIYSYLDGVDKLYIIDNSNEKNEYEDSSKIEYIFNNENLGIATALNIGAQRAIKENFQWLITMDQDSIYNIDDIKKIKKYIEEHKVDDIGIVSPWHSTKLHVKKPNLKIDYPLDVMTSGNFLNLHIYTKVGAFRDDFFIDGVDIEYCLRLKKQNYKILRMNEVELQHNLGNITYRYFFKKEFLCLNHNYLRIYYRVRNYNYIKKEYQDVAPDFCNMLVKIKALVWCIIFYEHDKINKLKSVYYAKNDFKRGILGKYNH